MRSGFLARVWYWVFKFAIIGPLAMWYVRPRWSGREHLPRKGALVLASNHLTMIDPVVVSLGVSRKVIFVAKTKYYRKETLNHRALAWFLDAVGQVPIDSTGARNAAPALEAASRILTGGGVWALFPEGTRSPDGRLYRGHTGVMRVALPLGVPVVPVGVSGTREVRLPGQKNPCRGRVRVSYGEPMDLSMWAGRQNDPLAWREATDALMTRIAELTGQEVVGRYPTRAELDARDAP